MEVKIKGAAKWNWIVGIATFLVCLLAAIKGGF